MSVLRIKRSSLTAYVGMLVGASAALLLWPGMLRNMFVTRGYEPHGYCVLWQPNLVSLYVLADSLIGFSYVGISFTLAYLVYRARRDIPFSWVFLAFGGFIIACGATHFMDVWTLWVPTYWLSGYVKLLTAAASVATALVLPPLVPRALHLVRDAKVSDERRRGLESAHQELERLYTKSTELDRLKSDFFASVSHELRTPLTLILGPTRKLLGAGDLSAEERHDLEVIERNAATLLKQVNDLLDVAKLEAGKMSLERTDTDLAALVQATAAHFDGLAAEKRIDFVVDTPPALPTRLDREKIGRVLLNLLSNAFKFTGEGGRIRLALHTDATRAIVEVQDDGPGVPSGQRDVIFERFRQGDSSATRRYGGTGLGLAIAKEFVELHDGTVVVVDAPGGGALFRVELPLEAPAFDPAVGDAERDVQVAETVRPTLEELRAPEDAVGAPAAATRRATVLVVEDHVEMRRFIAEILAEDYRVLMAANGADGLRVALKERPDLILSDVMMPGSSGDQLVRDVRAHPGLSYVPVVLLSAKTDEAFRVQSLRDGAQDYLLKPFSAEELRARIGNLVATKRARELLQAELRSQSEDVAMLAGEVATRTRAQKEVLESLRRSEARFRRLVEANIIGVIVADFEGRILEANDAFLQMLGLTRAEAERDGLRWDRLTPPEYRELDERLIAQVKMAGSAQPVEKEYLRADGTRVAVLLGVALLEGTQASCVCFILDLTRQKRAEEQQRFLAEASALFASSLEYERTLESVARLVATRMAAWCAIDLVQPSEQITRITLVHADPAVEAEMQALWSPAHAASGKVAPAPDVETDGKSKLLSIMPAALVLPDPTSDVPAAVDELVGGPGMVVPLVARERTLGIMVLGRRRGSTAYVEDDLMFAVDLVQRAALAADNARLYHEAREAVEVRDEFLSIASHELKTPVTSLLGYTQVLERRLARQLDAAERDRRAVRVIVEQSERLNKLIGTLLDLSRVQRGVFTVERRPVDLVAIVRTVVEQVEPTLVTHSVKLICVEETLVVEGDEQRLEQVVQNLLQNAVKYSPEGGEVTVRVERKEQQAVLSVADRGIGIPEAARTQIFDRFFRASNVDRNNISGFGIGLYVVNEIVSRHGGSVEVSSAEGQGSTFTVSLPLASPPE